MKKILSIGALCLIAVLAAVIIIFAVVDKNFNPNLQTPDYIQICINKTSNANVESYDKNDEISERKDIYNNVMKLYNDSFNQKIMSGIFQGIVFSDTTIVRQGTSVSSLLSGGTFIAFNYNDTQILKLNGKVYSYNNETNIEYRTLYVEVKNSSAMTDINIYVKKIDSDYSYYRFVVKAEQAELYDYLHKNFA